MIAGDTIQSVLDKIDLNVVRLKSEGRDLVRIFCFLKVADMMSSTYYSFVVFAGTVIPCSHAITAHA
jgi:hypothetical protein